MLNKITIKTDHNDKHIIKKAHINFGGNQSFYVKIPLSEKSSITELSDPWLNILIFKMMAVGGDFYINGTASESLVSNLEMFSFIWNKWCPDRYKPVHIIPKTLKTDIIRPGNNRLITAFSGGLDAAYTAYKYKNGLQNGRKYVYDTCVMIHGADIPVSDKRQFDAAFASAKKMTDDLHLKLIPVITNYRSYNCMWGFEFGAIISGILSFFSKKFAFGAATDASVDNFSYPWGMNLISDRFLSSYNFQFISDGMEHNRIERISMIKNWSACINNLRVCWENNDKSKNCGKCEKCIRTKLELLCLGIKHLPTMPSQFSANDLKYIQNNSHMSFFREIYDFAKAHNSLSPDLLKQLDEYINAKQKHKKHHHSLFWHLYHMKF